MLISSNIIVFGVQAVIRLGLSAQAAYEQHVVDKDVSLPLLSGMKLPEVHAQ